MDNIEFVTNRQWDSYASRIFNQSIREHGSSLSRAGIRWRAHAYIIEIRDDSNGMLVRKGWREAMKRDEPHTTSG